MNDPRGSIWRKWDLHIHTPASYHWSGEMYRNVSSKEHHDRLTLQVIEAINKSDVEVFGIMDYWTFDGYFAIKQFLTENPHIECKKTIFPGIELRIVAPTDYRLNIHVLLSNKLSDQQIKDFKSRLKIEKRKRNLSDDAIIDAGQHLHTTSPSKAKKHGFREGVDNIMDEYYLLGCKTIEITRESFEDAIYALPERTYVVILPYDTSDGLEDLNWKDHPYSDTGFMCLANIFEARKRSNIELFLGIETEKNKSFIQEFISNMGGRPKPVVSGSDAHAIAKYGVYPSNKITWIKADPTFDGLYQTLIEPRGRTFIGEQPSDLLRVETNQTKYLESLQIIQSTNFDLSDEIWFDNLEVPLNSRFIAIIGNKGNGKSAFVDILGLACDYHQPQFFSFLSETKFRNKKLNKAKNFEAIVTWRNGFSNTKNLDEVSSENTGKITYIPQQFFEKICNETEINEESDFDKELKKVIFSHIPEHKKLNHGSIKDIVDYMTIEITNLINNLKSELSSINNHILQIEEQLTDDYKRELEHRLHIKMQEFEAHEILEPLPVEKPTDSSSAIEKITDLRNSINNINTEINEYTDSRKTNTNLLAIVDKIKTSLENFKNQYNRFNTEVNDHFSKTPLSLSEIITLTVNDSSIEKYKQELLINQQELDTNIIQKENERQQLLSEIEHLQQDISQAEQAYQAYLTDKNDWDNIKTTIIGDSNTQGTVKYFEAKISEISEILPSRLIEYENKRLSIVKQIYKNICKIIEIYKDLYKPVQEFIKSHPIIRDKYKLGFEVSVNVKLNFIDRFMSYIKRNVSGTFKNDGENIVRSMIEVYDFNNESDIIEFINELMKKLKTNMEGKSSTIQAQLRNIDIDDFYNLIFGLDYLIPNYELRLDDKRLVQLSPGERGILLLIFYLLIDKDNCPLIIDQPEENLDNQSIYELLVPCIEEAKKRRQIILVTHNANLAVVCDADQVIHAQINKQDKNRVMYTSGAIENPIINKFLVDILEGTLPAFTRRQEMYQQKIDKFIKLYS